MHGAGDKRQIRAARRQKSWRQEMMADCDLVPLSGGNGNLWG